MKHRAPLLSALITILRSVGPVISTRRSRRSGGAGATVHADPRTERVASEERRALPLVEPRLAFGARLEQLGAAPAELALQAGDERERLVGQDLVEPGFGRPEDLDAVGEAHAP